MQAMEHEPDELVGTRVRYFRALRFLKRNTSPHDQDPAGHPARPPQFPELDLQPLAPMTSARWTVKRRSMP